MGYLTAPPRTELPLVMEGYGRIMGPSGAYDRSKFWLKDDGTLIIATLNSQGSVERQEHHCTAANFASGGKAAFDTAAGRWNFLQADCTCGYGTLAYAAPVDGRITITRVRPPEWVTGL